MLGYCWPSVLSPLLTHSSPESVRELLSGIEAVLVEFPAQPDTWQLFGDPQLGGRLDRLGFLRKQEEDVAAASVSDAEQ